MFSLPKKTTMTPALLAEYIGKHKAIVRTRYQKLQDAYENNYDIYNLPKKANYKPDNRISVNFAKYIVDTMNGFFIGNPIKVRSDDTTLNEYLQLLDQYNDQDDNNAELSKLCSIFGSANEMYYLDKDDQVAITYVTPMQSFVIYDNSIVEEPMFFVRYFKDNKNIERGSWSDNTQVQHFVNDGSYKWDGDAYLHGFDGVPATEYLENGERIGIFESALPMINAYNKAISEKANDVDYFADAYLKVLGTKLESDEVKNIRDNRIVNFEGSGAGDMVVEFMEKPNADDTQENLINRLERMIYQISMVANISDEKFATSSGIALKYKLLSMQNLAKTKERKFISGMNRRYKIIFSNPLSKAKPEDWVKVMMKFSFNVPANILDEAEVATKLEGVVSKDTQLNVLSIIDDVKKEIDRINSEDKVNEESIVDKKMFGEIGGTATAEVQGKQLNGAQTQSLIAIMAQYSGGGMSEGQAINLISTAIGIEKGEAKALLNGDM